MNSKLLITHNSSEICVDDAISITDDVESGYIYAIPELYLETQNYYKFIQDVQDFYSEFETLKYDYSRSPNNMFMKFKNDKFRIYVKGNSKSVVMSVCSKTEETNHKIFEIFSKYDSVEFETEMFINSYYMSGNNVSESSKEYKYEDLKYLSKNYYPYIDTNLMFDQFFTGAENILLCVGKPGCGKSKLASLALKYAFENPDKIPYDKMENNSNLDYQYIVVAYVKSTTVLSNDNFWQSIQDSHPDFVIIDDLDYMLTKRDSEVSTSDDMVKNQFLNHFLSFTDGFEKHKCKFIITTNQAYSDIDTALLRKGRLFDILELRELTNSEALVIWKEYNLKEQDFHKLFTEEIILPADLGSEINKRLNKRINDDALRSYIKESGISKIQKARKRKKISL